MERSLYAKQKFDEFDAVMNEYFEKGHAERVPLYDLEKSLQELFCLPKHVVKKESSTTTKIRHAFDASAKSSTGVSLNDALLVGPTIHPPLFDDRVALVADVNRMYHANELIKPDRDIHQFVWRRNPKDSLLEYLITRVIFGVSASSFIVNMSVKQNAIDFAMNYPLAINAVTRAFYVDDGLTGADSTEEAIELQRQLQQLFSRGGFLLHKWNSNEQVVLQHIPPELQDPQLM